MVLALFALGNLNITSTSFSVGGTAAGWNCFFAFKRGIFRTPSKRTSPSSADAGSHPRCEATAFRVMPICFQRMWITHSRSRLKQPATSTNQQQQQQEQQQRQQQQQQQQHRPAAAAATTATHVYMCTCVHVYSVLGAPQPIPVSLACSVSEASSSPGEFPSWPLLGSVSALEWLWVSQLASFLSFMPPSGVRPLRLVV